MAEPVPDSQSDSTSGAGEGVPLVPVGAGASLVAGILSAQEAGWQHLESSPSTLPDPGPSTLTQIRAISDGAVAAIARSGPVLAGSAGERRRLRRSTFVAALGRRDRVAVTVLSLGWLASLTWFWQWWLEPVHQVGLAGMAVNSAVLLYVSGFPLFFIMSANRLRRVNPAVSVPLLRLAFVVTRAPSEPWEVARSTLAAMLDQDFPFDYDVWLCDEQPSAETFDWCVQNGAKLSTRYRASRYHRESWPRRTRCKEGNLAYFYDRWGYQHYDVVVQLDCDHRPSRTYLAEMVRPFSDPSIGYVAAPSVCDTNASTSWSARGRLHKEATFHGPFQLGHSDGFGPLCIGSHYAVRTNALRDIGGLGPDLAEDFTTTFLLNAAGWQGAFAIDAEAHGDGPTTFRAMTVQEYQWSRSLTTVLLGLVPRHLGRLPWLLRLRFLYALSYYVLLTTTTLIGLALAPVAAVTGLPWMNVDYLAFLAHWWLISGLLLSIVILLRRRGFLRPPGAPIVSWENWLYSITRWPFVALGVCAALVNRVRPRAVMFKVTPKTTAGLERLPVRVVIPFFVIAAVSSGAAIFGEVSTSAVGYVFLSLLSGTAYAATCVLVPLLHAREIAATAGARFSESVRATILRPLAMGLLAVLLTCVGLGLYPGYALHEFQVLGTFGIHAFGR